MSCFESPPQSCKYKHTAVRETYHSSELAADISGCWISKAEHTRGRYFLHPVLNASSSAFCSDNHKACDICGVAMFANKLHITMRSLKHTYQPCKLPSGSSANIGPHRHRYILVCHTLTTIDETSTETESTARLWLLGDQSPRPRRLFRGLTLKLPN